MERRIPLSALLLGLAGAIPFVVLSTAFALGRNDVDGVPALSALIGYGAVILSFLGGVRWGAALYANPDKQGAQFALSVVPSLIAWIAVLIPTEPQRTYALFPDAAAPTILLLAVLAQGVADVAASRGGGLPQWYGRLRLILTVIVGLSLLLAVVAAF